VCYAKGNPEIVRFADSNVTDSDWQCVRADELELAAKLAYYAYKFFRALPKFPL
jgi:hypothetical protein